MLGRGVKRKWSCLEELQAETLHGETLHAETLHAETLHGETLHAETLHAAAEKEQDEEGGFLAAPSTSDMSLLQQRRLVLGLCVEKLRGYQAGMELSLRRSVLLINTLRQLQEDMQSDGDDGEDEDDEDDEDEADDEDDLSPSPPLSPSSSSPSPSPPLSPSPSPPLSPEADQWQKPPPAAASINTFSDAMGYLGDLALDLDVFEDIDTSMYETSSDLPSGWAAGSPWPVSVSLWADDDAKTRSATGSLQACLMDLNELDHIMEILVKS